MRLGLVVPVYDEQARIREFAPDLFAFIRRQPDGSELLFVDDGSTDGTPDVLEAMIVAADDVPATVLRVPHRGKGAALTAGLTASSAEVLAFCDIDLSTPLEDLQRIIDAARRTDLLAIGSRDLATSTLVRAEGRTREALGRIYNRLVQACLTPGVVDTQCGAKAASATVWRQILARCSQQGFAWDVEVVAVARALAIRVQEVPIRWRHDPRSKVRVLRDGFAMVRETPRIWRSANAARSDAPPRPQPARVGQPGIFDDESAAQLGAADHVHWWFRSKAAYVATAVRRTARADDRPGLLVDGGGGSGSLTALIGWPTDRVLVVEGNRLLASTARHGVGLSTVLGTVEGLPLASDSAAAVSLLDVIEHLEAPDLALEEARRVLGSTGRLIVNVPAHRWLWSTADVALGHQRRYSRRALRQEVESAGFEVVLLTHTFSWLVPPVWLVRRWARPSDPELGLERRSRWIDVTSLGLTALERMLVGRIPIPFGTSLLCVARPQPSDPTRPSKGVVRPMPTGCWHA